MLRFSVYFAYYLCLDKRRRFLLSSVRRAEVPRRKTAAGALQSPAQKAAQAYTLRCQSWGISSAVEQSPVKRPVGGSIPLCPGIRGILSGKAARKMLAVRIRHAPFPLIFQHPFIFLFLLTFFGSKRRGAAFCRLLSFSFAFPFFASKNPAFCGVF